MDALRRIPNGTFSERVQAYLKQKEFAEWETKVRSVSGEGEEGRYLIAGEEGFQAGERVFTDFPILTVVSQSSIRARVCDRCFTHNLKSVEEEEDEEEISFYSPPSPFKLKNALKYHCGNCLSIFWCSKGNTTSPLYNIILPVLLVYKYIVNK